MDASELLELWNAEAGRGRQNKDRPAFVRAYREELSAHISTDAPIPDESASLAAFREWLETYKATVTRQLSNGANTTEEGGE